MPTDYRPTVFLPKTDFPMRGDLPKREPACWRAGRRWAFTKGCARPRAGARNSCCMTGRPTPMAHLHLGHALNKILKDVVNRAQQMLGKDAPYVPGWDCHGLPIEWIVEEEYRAKKQSKDSVPIGAVPPGMPRLRERIGSRCRRREFKRLGVIGDWDNPYPTMSFDAEAQIVREIGKFLINGGLYKGAKPVLWSVVEQTALAEAEVEYHDHRSNTVWVRFPIVTTEPAGAGRRRGGDLDDDALDPARQPRDRLQRRARICGDPGRQSGRGQPRAASARSLLVARHLIDETCRTRRDRGNGRSPVSRHRARRHGRAPSARRPGLRFRRAAAAGEFVEADQGTGLVHIAPGHGADDWELGQAHGLPVPDTVGPDGVYLPHVPLFAGRAVYRPDGKPGDANEAVIAAVDAAGGLLARGTLVHSYPHSWRSKAPLIFRNTPQWFISMAANGLREKALEGDRRDPLGPAAGQNRIDAMIESKPDWCVSRQRAWGVPIPVLRQQQDRRAAARPGGGRARRRRGRARGRRCLVPRRRRAVSRQRLRSGRMGARSPTSSRCGSIPARPTPSCWSSGPS